MKILYVEDEPNDATLVDLYVRTTPHELVLAKNRDEAWQLLNSTQPDLILLDVILGAKRDGYALARELRESGFSGQIIALTGLSTPQDLEACHQAGFSQVLCKPYTIQQLANVLTL
jgi:CheY-like chemotaxis protein